MTILNPGARKTFTADERKRIAAGWRSSTLSQTRYAAQHGIEPRTLRLWLRQHAPSEATPEAIRKTGQRMLEALRHAAVLLEEALGQTGDFDRPARDPVSQKPPLRGQDNSTSATKKITFD